MSGPLAWAHWPRQAVVTVAKELAAQAPQAIGALLVGCPTMWPLYVWPVDVHECRDGDLVILLQHGRGELGDGAEVTPIWVPVFAGWADR